MIASVVSRSQTDSVKYRFSYRKKNYELLTIKVSPTGSGSVAANTGNMPDRIEIPTANLGFLTTPSSKKLSPGDCDKDRQPEMAIKTFWAPILPAGDSTDFC